MNHYKKYIICDVARFGSDTAIVTVWYGLVLYEYYTFPISSTTMIQQCINTMRKKHGISATNTLADEDGVGGGVVDNCKIMGFTNNGKPSDPAYRSIKDQCGYLLAEHIQGMYFRAEIDQETKERIEQELGQLKTYEIDKDGKLRIMPKIKIKENIGRSPDWLDVFIMRMYYYAYDITTMDSAVKQAQKYLS